MLVICPFLFRTSNEAKEIGRKSGKTEMKHWNNEIWCNCLALKKAEAIKYIKCSSENILQWDAMNVHLVNGEPCRHEMI